MKAKRMWRLIIAALLPLLAGVTLAWAFAEEPLTFRDPYTGQTTDEEISTIHDDLTYVLALAAGFSITDSQTLQIWNQLTDSEQLGPGDAISYTNAGGAFAPAPDPDVVCQGRVHAKLLWPRWEDMKDPASITSRYGPYSPFFHFPHQTAQEVGALRDWGWGKTDKLIGYQAYAWGRTSDLTVMRATCRYTQTIEISTTIAAGSLEAFATYLHALADSYSHLACIATMDSLGMPWPTHTTPPIDDSVPACDYHPNNPQNDDVHGREFGSTAVYTDSLRTDAAIQHVYQELVARGLEREGRYFPLSLDAAISGTQTLNNLLYAFVHNWTFDQAANRRTYADQIAVAVLAQRVPIHRVYLPTISK